MKKLGLALFVIFYFSLLHSACRCAPELTPKSEIGKWDVVSVNCPEVLIRKGRQEKSVYFHYTRKPVISRSKKIEWCENNIKPGWIVIIGKYSNQISFFPPPTPPTKSE